MLRGLTDITLIAGLLCCSSSTRPGRSASSIQSGTSILIRVTASNLMIAADGRMHTAGNAPAEAICKIHLDGDVVFTNAGLIRDQFSGFDLAEVAKKAVAGHAPLASAIDAFDARVQTFLLHFLPEIHAQFPSVYKSFDHNPGISVAFGQMKAGKPVLYIRSFSSLEDPSGAISIEIAKHDCVGNCQDTVMALGHFGKMEEYLRANPAAFREPGVNPADLSVRLLRLEAAASPLEVGPPYSVMTFGNSGSTWAFAGACGRESVSRGLSDLSSRRADR